MIRKAIARGVQEGIFGYFSTGTPSLGSDGKYLVPAGMVRFEASVAEDEIDLETGFLMIPQAIPRHEPVVVPIPSGEKGTEETPIVLPMKPTEGGKSKPGPVPKRVVEVSF